MSRWISSRIFWGVLFILGGILFFLQNLNILPFGGALLGAAVLAVFGIFVLSAFFSNRSNWWLLIPGILLLDLAVVTLMDAFSLFSHLSGAVFLAGIAISFLAVYLANRSFWWAIIPMGVLLTLSAITAIEDIASHEFETGGIFFLGIGLTFALVGLLPNPAGSMNWAFIPALVMIVLGVLLIGAAVSLINIIWPVALILVGLLIIYRTFLRRRA